MSFSVVVVVVVVSYADNYSMCSFHVFHCFVPHSVNVVCYTLCFPSIFECEKPRQVHQCGFMFVCVLVFLSVVPWFTFGAFAVCQYIIN